MDAGRLPARPWAGQLGWDPTGPSAPVNKGVVSPRGRRAARHPGALCAPVRGPRSCVLCPGHEPALHTQPPAPVGTSGTLRLTCGLCSSRGLGGAGCGSLGLRLPQGSSVLGLVLSHGGFTCVLAASADSTEGRSAWGRASPRPLPHSPLEALSPGCCGRSPQRLSCPVVSSACGPVLCALRLFEVVSFPVSIYKSGCLWKTT